MTDNQTTNKSMQTIGVSMFWPGGNMDVEFEIKEDASIYEIGEAAEDRFSEYCSFRWQRKERTTNV